MIYIILICVLVMVFGILAFIENVKMKKEKKQEQKNEKINNQTIEQIDEITSGDINNDFNAGVDLLHDLAKKRK